MTIFTSILSLCFYKALNSGCVEGDDVICPDSVLSALISHGWFIPTEQQVSGNTPYFCTVTFVLKESTIK